MQPLARVGERHVVAVDADQPALRRQLLRDVQRMSRAAERRIDIHAVRTDVQTVQTLLKQEKYEQADDAIRNLNRTFQKERFHPYCQNNLLQAILEGKRLRARQNHIQVSYEILLPEELSVDTADLSSVFFNLMDNAIEACNTSGNPNPEIRLSANISNGFLTVYMHNTKNQAQIFTHQTTKSNSGIHGYGLSIIEDICQRYNGSYQWINHEGMFDSIVLLQCNLDN